MIVSLYKHRGYIWRTALSDVRNRYAGAGFGVVWNLLQPLSMILIFTVIFTKIMTVNGDLGAPFPIYLCSAMLPWTAFSECLNRGSQAFIANAPYLRKLPIPEQVFVAQTALSTAIGLAVSFSALMVVALIVHHQPSWHWLLLPIPFALLLGMGFGLGMMLGTLNAFIRDVGQAVPIILQIWFWTYPIVYNQNAVPSGLSATFPYNPIHPFMATIRSLFIHRELPPWPMWLGMIGWTTISGLLGYLVLRKLRPELRDVI